MNNIAISKIQHYTCYEYIIAFISEQYNLQYEIMFAKEWDFNYDLSGKKALLGEKILGDFEPAVDYLAEYAGLSFLVSEVSSDGLLSICESEISAGRYVLIPSFRQSILKKYREVDSKQTTILMVVGMENGKICCADVHGEVGDDGYALLVKINTEDFIEGIDEDGRSTYMTYTVDTNAKNDMRKDVLKNQISKILKADENGNNSFQLMRIFAKELEQVNAAEEVSGESSVEKSPIVSKIKEICRARFLFNYFLKTFTSEKQSFFSDCVYEMNKIGTYWSTILSTVIKMYYKKNYSHVGKISDMIRKVADLEEQLAGEIKLYLSRDEEDAVLKINEQLLWDSSMEAVDLSAYLNNRGLSFEDGKSADYAKQQYMRLEASEENLKLLQFSEQKKDNIVCEGQNIKLKNKKGKALFILANAEGYRSDFIKIRYSDGKEEEKLLGISNWFGAPMFCEMTAVQGTRYKDTDKYRKTNGNTGDKASIFEYSINIMEDKEIDYIELPHCSDIHIFNIFMKGED